MANLLKQIFLSIWFVTLFAAPALAADPGHDYSSDPPLSELTRQELQQWAVYYWQHQDTGVWSSEAQAFEFTHPEEMPSGFVKFSDAYGLFEDIYQDQLNLDTQGEYYGIRQLINDDAQVRNQFKIYTTTGLLIMGAASAPAAVLHHQMAAIEAMTLGESYTVGQLQYLGQYAVVTVNLRRLPRPTLLVPPVPVPIANEQLPGNIQNLDYWLREEKNRLSGKHLHVDDHYPNPGFDCDDFSDAFTIWLRKRFQAATFEVLFLYWKQPSGKEMGHTMIKISKGGYYWILDPKSGTLLGPFTDDTPPNVSPILEAPVTPNETGSGYGVPIGTPIEISDPCGPEVRGKDEPPSWWHSPAMREHFEHQTGYHWYWYAPANAPTLVNEVVPWDPDPDIETLSL